MTDLGTLGGTSSAASGINNSETIVGSASTGSAFESDRLANHERDGLGFGFTDDLRRLHPAFAAMEKLVRQNRELVGV